MSLSSIGEIEPRRSVVLSQAEVQVLRGICRALTNKEIAWEMATTERMVGKRLHAIMKLLRLRSRMEVLIWCLQRTDVLRSTEDQVVIDASLHGTLCSCRAIYCTAMRMAHAPDDRAAA